MEREWFSRNNITGNRRIGKPSSSERRSGRIPIMGFITGFMMGFTMGPIRDSLCDFL
jgi:hypothetical protein